MSDQRVCATCSPRGVLMQAMTGRGLLSDGKEEGASLGSPAPSHRHKRPQLYLPYPDSCLSTLAPGPEAPPCLPVRNTAHVAPCSQRRRPLISPLGHPPISITTIRPRQA